MTVEIHVARVVVQKKSVVTVRLGIVSKTTNVENVVVICSKSDMETITKEQQELMSRMLLERISQAGIARVLQISEDTVQRYVNARAVVEKKQVEVSAFAKKAPECSDG
jgi:hypothetical protein